MDCPKAATSRRSIFACATYCGSLRQTRIGRQPPKIAITRKLNRRKQPCRIMTRSRVYIIQINITIGSVETEINNSNPVSSEATAAASLTLLPFFSFGPLTSQHLHDHYQRFCDRPHVEPSDSIAASSNSHGPAPPIHSQTC